MKKEALFAPLIETPNNPDRLMKMLPAEFQPRIEPRKHNENSVYVLRSTDVDSGSAIEAHIAGQKYVRILNAAFLAAEVKVTLRCSGAAELVDDGSCYITYFAQLGGTFPSITIEGFLQVGNSTSTPQPSFVQQAYDTIAKNDDLEEAAEYLASSREWVELYKAFEIFEDNLPEQIRSSAKRFKRTANALHRHSKKYEAPSNPMALEEASSLVKGIFRDEVNKRMKPRG